MQALLAVARGDAKADLILSGGRLVNVFSGEVYPVEMAIFGGHVAGVSRDAGTYEGRETIELDGEYLAPGFIDAHVHIESSLMLPAEYANAVMPHGTTAVVSDPHEIANVHGLEGIKFMLAASDGLPLARIRDAVVLRAGHSYGNLGRSAGCGRPGEPVE